MKTNRVVALVMASFLMGLLMANSLKGWTRRAQRGLQAIERVTDAIQVRKDGTIVIDAVVIEDDELPVIGNINIRKVN